MTDRSCHEQRDEPRSGWVLIEVVVAIALAVVLLVPLASGVQAALARSDQVRSLGGVPADGRRLNETMQAWEWGPMVVDAVWSPGPCLVVQVYGREQDGLEVGVWTDGWFLGGWETESCDKTTLPSDLWNGWTGSEVVLRVRSLDEAWGPPWRTLVPDEYGVGPAGTAVAEAAGLVVGHSRELAATALTVSWDPIVVTGGTTGAPFFPPIAPSGPVKASDGQRRQSWWMAPGRELDVYF